MHGARNGNDVKEGSTQMHHRDDGRVYEEAADWLYRLAEDNSPKCEAEFDRWLRESPLHAQEFLLAHAMTQELAGLDRSRVAALCEGGADSVVSLGGRAVVPHPATTLPAAARDTTAVKRPRQWLIAAACLVILCLGALLFAQLYSRAKVYVTAIGAQQSIKLDDGSVIHLNTDSSVEVRMDGHRRLIRLVKGEALFAVAHDSARPFLVETDNATVRAVGTEFNVHRAGDSDTRVAVIEGVVQVSSALQAPGQDVQRAGSLERLAAGEEAVIAQHGVVKALAPDIERAVAWRARRLVFQRDRLIDIVEEFNRYNRRQIRIEDEPLRAQRVSGIFDADDVAPLLQFIEQLPDVVVSTTDEEIVIRARPTS